MQQTTRTFHADGMHCHGCEHAIEAALVKIAGVSHVRASYPTEAIAVEFDQDETDIGAVRVAIEKLGYRVYEEARPRLSPLRRVAIVVVALIALAAIILIDTRWISAGGAPNIAQHPRLELIFLLGLLTGFHCIGMCGGFVVTYVAADARAGRASGPSHLAYATGKTLSYALIGGLFGSLGAFIAFTPFLRAAAGVLAGAFLIVFGLNMLGLFAPLRRIRLGLPAPMQAWVFREASGRHRPLVIGLLNGLMIACGPLQAMYVMAAGTGSPVEGAKMLLAYGLGTLPVMLSYGALTSYMSSALTHRLLKASGLIVVALGAVMINRGLILTGTGADVASLLAQFSRTEIAAPHAASSGAQKIEMEANRFGYKPDRFKLIAGRPVQWIINASEVTECNHRIVVPALGLEFDLQHGEQIIEFTPPATPGVIPWSCWMGMIRGEFVVIDAPARDSENSPNGKLSQPAAPEEMAPKVERREIYTIVRGDTLRKIARKLYRDEAMWRAILAANPGLRAEKLKIGRSLTLPRAP